MFGIKNSNLIRQYIYILVCTHDAFDPIAIENQYLFAVLPI